MGRGAVVAVVAFVAALLVGCASARASPAVAAELAAAARDGGGGGASGDEPRPFIVVFRESSKAGAALRAVCEDWLGGFSALDELLPPTGSGKRLPCQMHVAGLCRRVYRSALTGFSGRFRPSLLARLLECLPDGEVDHVEADHLVTVDASGRALLAAPSPGEANAPPYSTELWNLDRLDQRELPLDGKYVRPADAGARVTVYVLDSGVRASHQEFEGRVEHGWDFVDDAPGSGDCDGHGTHVAATVAGRSVGVAPLATVVSVRALDCHGNGAVSDVVAALDWIAQDAARRRPAVVALALGIARGSWSAALEIAVSRVTSEFGLLVVVAAGNTRGDACDVSPANIPMTLTVGASTVPRPWRDVGAPVRPRDGDDLYSWSATGPCVDIFAPGVDVVSACGGPNRCSDVGDAAYASSSGTSNAVPHAVGVAAIHLSTHPTDTPEQTKAALLSAATRGSLRSVLFSVPTTPNLLLHAVPHEVGLASPTSIQVQASSGPQNATTRFVYSDGALAAGWQASATSDATLTAGGSTLDVHVRAGSRHGAGLRLDAPEDVPGQCTLVLKYWSSSPNASLDLELFGGGDLARTLRLPEPRSTGPWLEGRVPLNRVGGPPVASWDAFGVSATGEDGASFSVSEVRLQDCPVP